MAKAVLTIEDSEQGVNVHWDFDPPIANPESEEFAEQFMSSMTYVMAVELMKSLGEIAEKLGGKEESLEVHAE